MARTTSFPKLFDDAFKIDLSVLKKRGFLRPNQVNTGVVEWWLLGRRRGAVTVEVTTVSDEWSLEIKYRQNDFLLSEQVELASFPSNLGRGVVWYFICPTTKNKCRTLYSFDGSPFQHREAFEGCFYQSQVRGKESELCNEMRRYSGLSKAFEELESKYFKRSYAGFPTKRYLKLLERIDSVSNPIDW